MLIKSNTRGFALLEVMLAVVIIAIATFGVYALYARSQQTVSLNQVKQQIIALSTTFSNLASAHVTQNVHGPQDLEALFYNSNQLSQQYFKISDEMKTILIVNPHGALSFTNVSPTGFTASIPTGTPNSDVQKDLCYQVSAYVSDCQASTDPKAGSAITFTVDGSVP